MTARSTLYVFDSCTWIELIQNRPDQVDRFLTLAKCKAITLGVPDIVEKEVRSNPELLKTNKENWRSRINELKQCAKRISSQQSSEYDIAPFLSEIEKLEVAIRDYGGIPVLDEVKDFFSSDLCVKIPSLKKNYELIIQCGLSKKRPFGNKNSMADAMILFSLSSWAVKHPKTLIEFHTNNFSDFSKSRSEKEQPHPEIAEHFTPTTNITYCFGQHYRLLAELCKFGPEDYHTSPPDRCIICDSKVVMESMICRHCDNEYACFSLGTDYSLKEFQSGYLVTGYYDDCKGELESERISCGYCNRKTFDIEFESMCSYHLHARY